MRTDNKDTRVKKGKTVVNSESDNVLPLAAPKTAKPKDSRNMINEKEWKKAVFTRWDDFCVLRRDVMLRIAEVLDAIPNDIDTNLNKVEEMRKAEKKLQAVLEEIENIDDSQWGRENFTSQLGAAMRKVERARMECMVTVSKFRKNTQADTAQAVNTDYSFFRELQSLSFGVKMKIGAAFTLPLIIGVVTGMLIQAFINYMAVR